MLCNLPLWESLCSQFTCSEACKAHFNKHVPEPTGSMVNHFNLGLHDVSKEISEWLNRVVPQWVEGAAGRLLLTRFPSQPGCSRTAILPRAHSRGPLARYTCNRKDGWDSPSILQSNLAALPPQLLNHEWSWKVGFTWASPRNSLQESLGDIF